MGGENIWDLYGRRESFWDFCVEFSPSVIFPDALEQGIPRTNYIEQGVNTCGQGGLANCSNI